MINLLCICVRTQPNETEQDGKESMKGFLTNINQHTVVDIIRNDRIRKLISQIVFYITFCVYMVASLLQYTSIKSGYPDFNKILTQITWICVYVAIANAILLADYSVMQIIMYVTVGVLMYYSYKNCGTRLVYQGFVLALSARQADWAKLRRILLYVMGAFIAVCMILYATGVLTGFEYYKDGRMRLVMGYNHPNVLGCIVMTFGLIWIANFAERAKIWDYLVILILTLFCWFGPMSRTAAISLGVALILMLVQRFFGKKLLSFAWVRWLLALSSPIYFLMIFALSYFYTPDSAFFVKINAALSGRVAFGRAFLEKYYHTWMGQKIKMVGTAESERTGQPNMYLDSAYMRLYVSVGIIALLIFLFVMITAMLYAIRKSDWGLIIGLLAFGLYGISEVYMMYVFYNVFLIGASYSEYSDFKLLGWKKKKHADL